MFRCSEKLSDDMVLWKFFSVERLLELLAKKRLYFTKTKFQQDPSEGFAPFKQIKDDQEGMSFDGDLYDEVTLILGFISSHEDLVQQALFGIDAEIEKESETKLDIEKRNLLIFENFLKTISPILNCSHVDELIEKWKKAEISVYTTARVEDLCNGLDQIQETLTKPFFTEFELEYLKKELVQTTYLCCFNKGNTINDLLWSYSKGNYGVAIEMNVGAIKRNFMQHKEDIDSFDLFLYPVEYNDSPNYMMNEYGSLDVSFFDDFLDDDLQSRKEKRKFFINALGYKKSKYRAEEEVRLIAVCNDEIMLQESNIFFPFDFKCIEKIHLNPSLKRTRAEAYKENLKTLFLQSFGNGFDVDKIVIDEEKIY